jgi:nucleotide-binding universal stress UspA family protein
VIKDILLVLDADRPCCCVLDAALCLAEGERASVHTLCLTDEVERDGAIGGSWSGQAPADGAAARSDELLHSMKESFFRRLSTVVLAGDWQCIDDLDARFVAPLRAQSCDISVMQIDLARRSKGREVAEALLRRSGSACLFVPDESRLPSQFDRIVVAWDGSAEARRAMDRALPLLQRASLTYVVVIGRPGAIESYNDAASIAAHLARHEVTCVALARESRSSDVTADLIALCKELEADLLVMGDGERLFIGDALFGGASYSSLVEPAVPILLSR